MRRLGLLVLLGLVCGCGGSGPLGFFGPDVDPADPGYGVAIAPADPVKTAGIRPSCGTAWLSPPFTPRNGTAFDVRLTVQTPDVVVYAAAQGPDGAFAPVPVESTELESMLTVPAPTDGDYRVCVQCVRGDRVVAADCSDLWRIDNVPPPAPTNARWMPL